MRVSPDVALLLEIDLLMLEGLGGQVLTHPERKTVIEVTPFSRKGLLNENLCDDSVSKTYARVKHWFGKSTIQINEEFIRLVYSEQRIFPCKHGSFRQFLTASLWHELGHIWDRKNDFSTEGQYAALMGGSSAFKSNENRAAPSSPDAYEHKNLRESFAVNLEWFLLDSTFACKRPATQALLEKALGFRPFSAACDLNWKLLTQSAYPEDHYTRVFDVNPARIYQVHYLFAGKGHSLMSRWGHAMIRLIVCAPHRQTIGPECMQDVSHHLVLSYRASVENPEISHWDGLRGKYPSLMFVYRFHEILQEYTKQELRELWSIPLPLESEQIEFFMKVTLERYWGYQAKYLFLSNNCGTESLRHLTVVDEKLFDEIGDFTPLQLFSGLSRLSGLEDATSRKSDLEAKGLYYPSHRPLLEEAVGILNQFGLTNKNDLKSFLKTKPQDRFNIYKNFPWGNLSLSDTRSALMNLQYIERYSNLKYNLNLLKQIMYKIEGNIELKNLVETEINSFMALSIRPWEIVRDGYGVPSTESFNHQFNEYLKHRHSFMNQSKSALDVLLQHPLLLQEKQDVNSLNQISNFIRSELARPIRHLQEAP
jgi:hypothetical protein